MGAGLRGTGVPFYESEDDLAREDRVARYLAAVMGCEQRKYEELNPDRVFLVGGNAFCYAEIKWRWNESTRYQTLMIDYEKLERGLTVAVRDGLPLVLAVKFTDGVFTWYVSGIEKLEVTRGGRYDRNDPNDYDWVAHIPMGRFTRV